MSTSQRSTTTRGIVPAGWLCLALSLLLMVLSLGMFFVYVPLALAAFVLSIVAMTQRRVAAGIVLLISTCAISTVAWLGLFSYRMTLAKEAVELEHAVDELTKKAALAAIEFEEVSGFVERDYMYCEGKVRNTGTTSVTYVKVAVEWLDDAKKILDTDWTYAVSSESLKPGGAKSFRIMTPADRRMSQFRYYVMTD